ncbi:MAG: GDSL-type esterase/lipase family protein [Bacteroidota bacterium]
MNRVFLTVLPVFLLFQLSCRQNVGEDKGEIFLSPKSPFIQYQGRIGEDDSAKILYWSGSSLKVQFKGEEMAIVLKDEGGDNYFNVLVNGELKDILRPDTVKKTYVLAENLTYETHVVELFKRTEWDRGKTWFYGFEPGEETEFEMPFMKKRRIEFYGNSITAAYAVEDYSDKDSPDSTYTNFYHSYAARTARHFQANYDAIVRSGIGITVSWVPVIMPEIWDRLDPTDPDSKWDFSLKPNPDVVVVNLLQNDSWLINMPDYPEYKKRFPDRKPSIEYVTARYQDFLRNIRAQYPAAHIISMLGNMDITQASSPWPKYVEEAVVNMKDSKVHSLRVAFKDTPGHPRVEEQEILAQALIAKIQEKVGWK